MSNTPLQLSYRWVIVCVSALILAIAMGSIVNGLSAFIVPMQTDYGWARRDISLINFSGIMGLAFGGLVMGPLADKRGVRPVVLFGGVALGLCYLAASYVTELWQFYLVFFVGGFFGAGAIFAPVMAAVGSWFQTGAGLAIGIASAGQALGQGAVPFVSSHLIAVFGTDGAFAATGAFMVITLIPLSLLLRTAPVASAAQLRSDNALEDVAIPTRRVIITMSAAIILCCICMAIPLMHLVPLIQDRGFAADEAGQVIFVMLLVAIVGRIAFGKLADIVGAVPAYMSATAWMTVMIFGFTYIQDLSTFYIYAVVYGFGYAGVMTGVLVCLRVLIPPSRRASAVGVVVMFGWFGHAIGGSLGGLFYDIFGDYTVAYGVAALAGVANLMIVATLWRDSPRPNRAVSGAS
jgi:MFS family permease